MFIAADQLLAHLVGDYILQSHWMATKKTGSLYVACVHAAFYLIPFMMLCSGRAYVVMFVTHALIDRYRLARYLVWAKNWISLEGHRPWRECSATGYGADVPPWLAVWLLIIADNILHIICNGLALKFL